MIVTDAATLFLLLVQLVSCLQAHMLSPLRQQKNRLIFKKLATLDDGDINKQDKNATSPVMFFEQKRDHFNSSDSATWQQAYVIVDKFYKPGGPVFFELGGEGPMADIISPRNLAYNLTKRHAGLMVSIEHRYYGTKRSIPVDTLTIKSLKYLSARQALADYAFFIQNNNLTVHASKDSLEKTPLPKNTKWITFGGSYPGALSAWMRYKYPEIVFAAHASSAPILAQADFWRYGYSVDVGLTKVKGGSRICADNWSRAVSAFDQLVATSKNQSLIKEMFGVYDDLDIRDLAAASSLFAGDIQYGRGPDAPLDAIDKICNGTMFPSFATTNATDQQLLIDYAGLIKEEFPNATVVQQGLDTRNFSAPSNIVANLWGWQFCNEFGYLQTGNPAQTRTFYSSLISVEYYEWVCDIMFQGQQRASPDVEGINDEFYGLDLVNRVSNVVFTNGNVDPWHWLGVNSDTMNMSTVPKNQNLTVILIENGHHCSDYGTPGNKSSAVALGAYNQIIYAWDSLLA